MECTTDSELPPEVLVSVRLNAKNAITKINKKQKERPRLVHTASIGRLLAMLVGGGMHWSVSFWIWIRGAQRRDLFLERAAPSFLKIRFRVESQNWTVRYCTVMSEYTTPRGYRRAALYRTQLAIPGTPPSGLCFYPGSRFCSECAGVLNLF